MRNYTQDARDAAKAMALQFIEDIAEQLDDGEASASFAMYRGITRWHRANHTDRFYSLLEAAQLLDQLSEHDVSGLWEGLSPRQAISAEAAHTYGNAVYSSWAGLIDHINSEYASGRSCKKIIEDAI